MAEALAFFFGDFVSLTWMLRWCCVAHRALCGEMLWWMLMYIYIARKLWPNFWRFTVAYSDDEARTNGKYGTYPLGFMITMDMKRGSSAQICVYLLLKTWIAVACDESTNNVVVLNGHVRREPWWKFVIVESWWPWLCASDNGCHFVSATSHSNND